MAHSILCKFSKESSSSDGKEAPSQASITLKTGKYVLDRTLNAVESKVGMDLGPTSVQTHPPEEYLDFVSNGQGESLTGAKTTGC